MLLVYQSLSVLLFVISPLIILIRIIKKREDTKRFKEKFCYFSKKRTSGKLIWFHGASIGEILSVIPLIEKLEENKKIKQILITSNTLSSSKILSEMKLKKTVHQFFPLDTNFHTQKFLNYWNPSLAIFIDSEIWPNMITNIKKKSISLLLLNARITKKSFKKWRIFRSSAKEIFQKFDMCFPCSLASKKYLQLLGVKKIRYIGNLKFSQTEEGPLKYDFKNKHLFKKLWCASSTHDSEEKICGLVHKKLKTKYKDMLTIIIPRHITRVQKIENEMKKLDLKVQIHNSRNKIKKETDIYLVNSYGKTKPFFKICKTVFLGGSLIKHGGQNPLEAARYGCKILHGPNISNFKEIYALLNKYRVSTKVNNINQIIKNVDISFKQKNNSNNLKLKIKKLGKKILNSTLKEVNFFVNKR